MPTLTIDGSGGDDTIVVTATATDSGNYTINGGAAVPFSGVTQVAVNGMAGNDTLTMVNAAGFLVAVLSGGVDDDSYFVDHASEAVVENPGEGTDTINTSINYTLVPNVENLTLLGSADLQGYGNSLPNTITGNAGRNLIDGKAGADVMIGGAGFDTYFVDDAGDVIIENAIGGGGMVFSTANFALSANLTTLVLRGGADLQGYGNSEANTLFGNSGNNLLDGGAGADRMDGGAGDDTYFVDNAGDRANEVGNAGNDAIFSSVNFTLPPNVETLVLQGTADLQGTGSGLADTLFGNSGNNVLDGRQGADHMQGGAGDDTYFVDQSLDQVFENPGEGTDTVFSRAHFTLSANVENLILQGSENLQGFGNNLANTLTGNAGHNLLDGGADADTMIGGDGNDTYFVDNALDVVVELSGQGTDTVFSSVNYVLSVTVENLILQGSADLQGYGSSVSNVIYGNSGNNLLDGGAGVDLMVGGAGNDTYFVDDPGDAAFEVAGEGNDAVFSTANYGLAADVETLVMQGSADLQGYGNNQVNTLYGNTGNNLINGAGGADTLLGGAGNDTYFVDDPGDIVFENANEGADAVFTTVSYTLTANVEALVLQGSGNLSGTGNALANNVYGNSGDNALDGGANADVLMGDTGNDTFVFRVGEADGDTVVDFAGNGASAGDSLQFVGYGAGASFTQNDATHWQIDYNGGASHEVITFSNGASIHASDVLFG
jgi:Ca2+-binding RTX toxin-like protein